MKLFRYLLPILLLGLLAPAAQAASCATPSGGESYLEAAAAGLSAGQWCEIDTSDITLADTSCYSPAQYSILQWNHSAVWDSVNGEIRQVGESEGRHCEGHYKYIESSNTWENSLDVPGPAARTGHSYDHNAIQTGTALSYYRLYNGTDVWTYNQALDSWSSTAIPGTYSSSRDICYGIEWNEARSTLQFFDAARADLYEWDGASTWNSVATGLNSSIYCPWMEYNPADDVMCFGGPGNMYCSDSSGTTTSKNAPSFSIDESADDLVADPVSGDILAYDEATDAWEEYDYGTNSWSSIAHSMPPISGWWTSTVQIPTYGVVAFVDQPGSAAVGTLYIYKHADGADLGLGTLTFNRPNLYTIGIELPLTGSQGSPGYDTTATVEYKVAGAQTWLVGPDLVRVRPDLGWTAPNDWCTGGTNCFTRGEEFSGMIWGLEPNTTYDIRVTITEPGVGTETRNGQTTTRAVQPDTSGQAADVVIPPGTSAATIQGYFDSANPGDIIEFAAGTHTVTDLFIGPEPPAAHGRTFATPLTIRGVGPETIIGDETGLSEVFTVVASHVVIENMTLLELDHSSGLATIRVDGRYSGFDPSREPVEDVTIRNSVIYGRHGINCDEANDGEIRDVHIVDNTLYGIWSWEEIQDMGHYSYGSKNLATSDSPDTLTVGIDFRDTSGYIGWIVLDMSDSTSCTVTSQTINSVTCAAGMPGDGWVTGESFAFRPPDCPSNQRLNCTWDDTGINMTGEGHTIEHNTLSGYGDSWKTNGGTSVDNTHIAYIENDVLWGGNDGFELDDAHHNVLALNNRISNTWTCGSKQPNKVSFGPNYFVGNTCVNTSNEPWKLNDHPNGVIIWHNTIVHPENFYDWLDFYGATTDHVWLQNTTTIANLQFLNNIQVSTNSGWQSTYYQVHFSPALLAGQWDGNGYWPNGSFSWAQFNPDGLFASIQGSATLPPGYDGANWEDSGQILTANPFLGGIGMFGSDWRDRVTDFDPSLTSSSTARNAGVTLPGLNRTDVGAVDFGATLPEWGARTAADPPTPPAQVSGVMRGDLKSGTFR